MIKFPPNQIKVRKTYWGARPEDVNESEEGGEWGFAGRNSNIIHESSGEDLAIFYNGSLLGSSCQLVYLFTITKPQTLSLVGIDYCFIRPPAGTWQNMETLLIEVYGIPLRGIMYKDKNIWLTDGGMTSLQLGAKEIDGEKTTCLFVRYNGEGTEEIIDHFERAKKELP